MTEINNKSKWQDAFFLETQREQLNFLRELCMYRDKQIESQRHALQAAWQNVGVLERVNSELREALNRTTKSLLKISGEEMDEDSND